MRTMRIIPDIIDQQDLYHLAEDCSVRDAAAYMKKQNVAAVCVTRDDRQLVGIMTERDMTRRVVAEGIDTAATPVSAVMTAAPDVLKPGDSALDALNRMMDQGYRHLPVVDQGRVVGMVSIRDLFHAVRASLEQHIVETEAYVFGDSYGGV